MGKRTFLRVSLCSILALILLSFVSANSYNIQFSQVETKALVEIQINLDNESGIFIPIPKDAAGISCSMPYEIRDCQIYTGGKNIELSYVTSSFIEKTNGKYYFVHNFVFPINANRGEIKLALDEGFIVDSSEIFPAGSEIKSDGKSIILVWNYKDKKAGDNIPLFVPFASVKYDWDYILIILAIILALALIIWGLYYFIKFKKKKGNYENYLIDAEKKVIEELKKADRNEMWQKQLQLKTGFSKAKLSRVVRNLESRNLIKKIPFGNTNKIRLS
jgi:hypothetical protein